VRSEVRGEFQVKRVGVVFAVLLLAGCDHLTWAHPAGAAFFEMDAF
jgi:hypothetical protein